MKHPLMINLLLSMATTALLASSAPGSAGQQSARKIC
jgi:hypothetical protein